MGHGDNAGHHGNQSDPTGGMTHGSHGNMDHGAHGTTDQGMDHGGTDHGGTDHGGTDHGGMDHGGTDHGGTDHGGTDHGAHAPTNVSDSQAKDPADHGDHHPDHSDPKTAHGDHKPEDPTMDHGDHKDPTGHGDHSADHGGDGGPHSAHQGHNVRLNPLYFYPHPQPKRTRPQDSKRNPGGAYLILLAHWLFDTKTNFTPLAESRLAPC